jgi:hypothetical protein
MPRPDVLADRFFCHVNNSFIDFSSNDQYSKKNLQMVFAQ